MKSTFRGGATRRIAALAILAAVGVAGGCGDSAAPRGAVQGAVTVGGRPVERGRILFTSRNARDGTTVSAVVEQGRYALAADAGPIVGANRIELDVDRGWGFAWDDERAYAATGGGAAAPNFRWPLPPNLEQTQILPGQNTFDVNLPAPSP